MRWMIENTTPDTKVALELTAELRKQIDSVEAIKNRQQEIVFQLDAVNSKIVHTDVIAEYLKHFGDIFDGMEPGQKRVLIQGLVKEIVIHKKDDCSLILTIPLPSKPQSDSATKKGRSLDEKGPLDPALYPMPDPMTVR